VTETSSALTEQPEFDVTICGGTLGIFLATALQLKGLRVCVVERAKLAGRAQEWNISRSELDALLRLGVLTAGELEAAIAVEFNPVRMQFKVGHLLLAPCCPLKQHALAQLSLSSPCIRVQVQYCNSSCKSSAGAC
jgi:hypothetical protein